MAETLALEMRGPAAYKATSSSTIKPAAKVEGKAKQSAAAAAKVEGKANQAAAIPAYVRSKHKPYVRPEDLPEPKVIAVRTERVEEDYIEYLRTRPLKMPSPWTEEVIKFFPELYESSRVLEAHVRKSLDLYDDILRQHDEKGYAVVGVEVLDNGMKRLFRLTEEATA